MSAEIVNIPGSDPPPSHQVASRRARLQVAASVLVTAVLGLSPVFAGTCKEPGSHLTKQEYRNVKTACEQMDAEMIAWKDPVEGRRRLASIQAGNFEYYVPTSDALRFKRQTGEDYIRHVTEFGHDGLGPGSYLRILATTAQGNRVATEMVSDIRRKSGSSYRNVHHQLFQFDDSGKVRIYKIYMDSAALARESRAQQRAVVMKFFEGITAAPPADFSSLFSDQIRWISERPGGANSEMDHAEVLKTIASLPTTFRQLRVTPDLDAFTQQNNKIAVEAKSHGIFANGTEYNNVYHFLFIVDGDKIKEIREYSPTTISPNVKAAP
jgi:ketosteroid isomerase-like protein